MGDLVSEKLFVHVDLGDGDKVLAGQLLVDEKQGRFKYERAYLDNPRAFAFDPVRRRCRRSRASSSTRSG